MPAACVPHCPAIRIAFAAVLVVALAPPASAAWMSGRGNDSSGVAYLAVLNDSKTGERIELNCTPAGQAFLALSWNAAVTGPPDEGTLTLRFVVDGSRRFAAAALFRNLDKGWGAAELATPDIIAPLTEALATGLKDFEVDVVQHGAVLAKSTFDMEAAPDNIGRYRSFCRM